MKIRGSVVSGALAILVMATPALAAPPADADDEEIVVPNSSTTTVQAPPPNTGEKVVVVVVKKGEQDSGVPAIGADPAEIEAYLRGLQDQFLAARDQFETARSSGTDADEDAAKERMKSAQRKFKAERDRLTTREDGLIAGGAVILSAGGISILTSLGFAIAYLVSGIDTNGTYNPDERYGNVAWGTLIGGVVGLGVGIPMLAVGVKRSPRDPGDDYVGRASPPAPVFTPGLTMGWVF